MTTVATQPNERPESVLNKLTEIVPLFTTPKNPTGFARFAEVVNDIWGGGSSYTICSILATSMTSYVNDFIRQRNSFVS